MESAPPVPLQHPSVPQHAGNFSEPVSLDNPHYVKPPDPTPMPIVTAKPTKKPASTGNEAASTPSAAPAVKPASVPNHHQGLGSSLIYVQDEPDPTPEPTAAPTPEPIIKTEYITIGPGMPYQADGNAHTLDVLYSAATNKQFITLQTKSGNTFYLVIDYDKPIDEEAELYETYFLNLVDERDLLALMSDEEKEAVPTPTPEIIYVTPEPTAVPIATAPPVQPDTPQTTPDRMTALMALAAIVAIGGVGAAVFFGRKKRSAAHRPDNDFDMGDDEDEDEQENEA